jgi:hypothetical protein
MRRSTCCLLVVLFGSWLSGFGQSTPKFSSPKIVATFKRVGLVLPLSPTTVYTPKSWGMFRVSIVMVCVVPSPQDGEWLGQLLFTDGAGQNPLNTFVVPLDTTYVSTGVGEFPIRVQAGKPIQFSTTGFTAGGSTYNVWVVVEQLM